MALKDIWKVIIRRWWLIVIPVAIVALYTAVTYQPPTTTYNVGVRYAVGQAPTEAASARDEERYYNWLGSEYIANGLADWVNGNGFKTAVSHKLAEQGIEVPAGAIGMVADNARSTLLISMTYPDPAVLEVMITAVYEILTEQNADALPQINEPILVQPLDEPIINPISAGLTSQLDLPIRLVVAFIAGLALAFVLDYLDPAIYGREEVDVLGLEILGEIPKK